MKLYKMIRSLITLLSKTYLSAIACLILWILIPMAILWTPTVVISGSMEPLIRTGDVVSAMGVSTDQVRGGAIKVGMVVLAVDPMKPDTLYTHRVIEIKSDKSMVTKGDANAAPDPIALPVENVKGIELLRIPFIGLPAQKMREGDTVAVIAMGVSVLFAALMIQTSKTRNRHRRENNDDTPLVSTRVKIHSGPFKSAYSLAASIAIICLVFVIGSSHAAFSGWAGQSNNSWRSAASYPAPGPAAVVCGGASYQTSANTTLTCTPGTVAGTTTNYTLTVTGTGALTQWSVTADWTGVANWDKSKAFGPGVTDTGYILIRNGYQIKGSANGSANPADSWNHAWISSTKAAEVFTVQVTTK